VDPGAQDAIVIHLMPHTAVTKGWKGERIGGGKWREVEGKEKRKEESKIYCLNSILIITAATENTQTLDPRF
jgi:hypothetical protein